MMRSLSATCFVAGLLAPSPTLAAPGQFTKLLPDDGFAEQLAGVSVATNGPLVLVGAPDDTTATSGAVYVFDALTGDQLMKLEPDDGQPGDAFGISVAALGDRAVVGASDDDDNGTDTGSAYVFDLTTGDQLSKLLPADGDEHVHFGWSVDLDESQAIVGAWDEDEKGVPGAAYLFDLQTGAQLADLQPTSGHLLDGFGARVRVQGFVALVGAPTDDTMGADAGAAYVFDTPSKAQLHKLYASDPNPQDFFGFALDLQGPTAVVGAFQDDANDFEGAVYVFDALAGAELLVLQASDGGPADAFGISVALHGTTLLVGADLDDDDVLGKDSGSTYVFDLPSGQELAKLQAPAGMAGDSFGFSVAVHGPTVVIGALADDENGLDAGAAYLVEGAAREAGIPFCFGDGSATACPCGNEAPPGSGGGCLNSAGVGAVLSSSGSASMTRADFALHVAGAMDGTPGVLFGGDAPRNAGEGAPFLDGLRCVSGRIYRIHKFPALRGGQGSYPVPGAPPLHESVGAGPGDTSYFQYWYRDQFGPCASTANTSNAVRVTWGI